MTYRPIPLPDRSLLTAQEAEEVSATYLAQMRRRHSVRHFDTAPISDVLLSNAISVAASAPSGANQQPWHFVIVKNPAMKMKIRLAAEAEEQKFYAGMAGDAWISALEPIGTHSVKAHLSEAPALIVVFAQRYGLTEDGARFKHYYVTESVGIAIGFLILGAFALSFAGILAGIWANKFDELAAITNFVIQPLTFLSGTFYSVDRLPAPFDIIASLNPVFYAIDGFRYGMIGVADRPLVTGFYCLVVVNVVLAILCYKALRSGYRLKS